MGYKMRKIEKVLRKQFFKTHELSDLLGLNRKEIRKYAMASNALYQISGVELVKAELLIKFINEYREFFEAQEGVYLTAEDAAKKLGISRTALMHIVGEAGSVYQVADQTLINVEETIAYIQRSPVITAPEDVPDIPKPKRLRGSQFIRDLQM